MYFVEKEIELIDLFEILQVVKFFMVQFVYCFFDFIKEDWFLSQGKKYENGKRK